MEIFVRSCATLLILTFVPMNYHKQPYYLYQEHLQSQLTAHYLRDALIYIKDQRRLYQVSRLAYSGAHIAANSCSLSDIFASPRAIDLDL